MSTDDIIALGLTGAAVIGAVLAVIAARRSQPWLIVPGAIVVAVGILIAALSPAGEARSPGIGVALAVALTLLGTVGGSPAVAGVLRLAMRDSAPPGDHGGILVRNPNEPQPRTREVLRGGATIGYLERLALIGAVLAGQAVAIAVIVAIKGLGRFSELETSEARERFIIGTLTSLMWAGAAVTAIGGTWG